MDYTELEAVNLASFAWTCLIPPSKVYDDILEARTEGRSTCSRVPNSIDPTGRRSGHNMMESTTPQTQTLLGNLRSYGVLQPVGYLEFTRHRNQRRDFWVCWSIGQKESKLGHTNEPFRFRKSRDVPMTLRKDT